MFQCQVIVRAPLRSETYLANKERSHVRSKVGIMKLQSLRDHNTLYAQTRLQFWVTQSPLHNCPKITPLSSKGRIPATMRTPFVSRPIHRTFFSVHSQLVHNPAVEAHLCHLRDCSELSKIPGFGHPIQCVELVYEQPISLELDMTL